MNLVSIVAITVFLSQSVIKSDDCRISNFKKAFPDQDYLVYGIREDSNILLVPSAVVEQSLSSYHFEKLVQADNGSVSSIENYNAMLIEVHGLLQFLTVWQEYKSTGKIYTVTRLSYFGAFRLVFVPTVQKVSFRAELTTLAYFSDLSTNRFAFKTTKGSRVFFYQNAKDFSAQYEIIFGRAGTKLFIEKIQKIGSPGVDAPTALMAVNKGTTKWMARRQKSETLQLDCVTETDMKFGIGILYSRRNLIEAYNEMGDSAFDCSDAKCKEELRKNDGKTYHDKEVSATHAKGSIYLGFRNGYIFAYRVINENEKFSEILFSLDLAHRIFKEGEIGKDEEFYLFSFDGKESIAVICGPSTYYRIYNTNPGDGIKVVYLKKSEMTLISQLKKKCRKVDYDSTNARLIFYMDSSTAHELKLTLNHDGVLKKFPDPKLNKFDNYRGTLKPYDGIESQWPFQLRNGRTIFYNENQNQKLVSNTKILTNYGDYVKALLYFPVEYIEDEYINKFRSMTSKFPISFYGIVDCTIFVIMKFEDFEKVNAKNSGCDRSYKMRAILLDSYLTVLRTKDDKNVEGVRIKVSIDYKEVEKGIAENEPVIYIHNLLDSEFEKNNSFTIAQNTFHTIHNIDDYTYYQETPRTECIYHFKRRKITKSSKKDVQDVPFPAFASPCDFEMSSAMYDETVRGVVYVMRRKNEAALVTPNMVVSDALKQVQNENFMNYFIYSTSFPYILYNDPKGASVISVDNPEDIKVTFNGTFNVLGFYKGKILYRSAEAKHILDTEIEAVEEVRDDSVSVTKAAARQDFEKVAFGTESEIIHRPEIYTAKCRLVNAPFFMAFVLKVTVLDMLLLLVLIVIMIYHRAHIIPARRRYKIKMGILKHRKKRKLRDRARRRLRKLNLLRRRRKKIQQENEAKRQAALIAAAVGALGVAQQGRGTEGAQAVAEGKKKSSSTSSSDLVTAGGEQTTKSQLPEVGADDANRATGATQ
uniref:Uncharacterized protein n=1 Tax=Setaria digitata TaxID=48799 RepID=A0A915Q5T1_9BILA